MSTIPIFPGNCPRNVSRDAKYSVRGNGQIGLLYYTDDDERWQVTTRDHPELAGMVNEVKVTHGSGPNGPFYINEFKEVIVPVGPEAQYYLAGTYDQPLQFEFEGKTISGEPGDFQGRQLQPGDKWFGPHAGIPYVLEPSGRDVHYWTFIRPNVQKKVMLSSQRGKNIAEQIARLLFAFKGPSGGRIYVNEFSAVFSPITRVDELEYVYIGRIDLDSWFVSSLVPRTAGTS